MGVRINTSVGYITPDKFPSKFFSDLSKRVDDDLHDNEVDSLMKTTAQEYFSEQYTDYIFLKLEEKQTNSINYPSHFYDLISNVDGEGDGHVLFRTPSENNNWHRYDDTIDHITHAIVGDDIYGQLTLLNKPIYPYMNFFDVVNRKRIIDEEDYRQYYNSNELPSGIIPEVPLAIKHIVRELMPEKGEDYYLELRPAFCVWWG
jgi:hypothetical protein